MLRCTYPHIVSYGVEEEGDTGPPDLGVVQVLSVHSLQVNVVVVVVAQVRSPVDSTCSSVHNHYRYACSVLNEG